MPFFLKTWTLFDMQEKNGKRNIATLHHFDYSIIIAPTRFFFLSGYKSFYVPIGQRD